MGHNLPGSFPWNRKVSILATEFSLFWGWAKVAAEMQYQPFGWKDLMVELK